MTEEERDKIIQKKKEVSEWLANVSLRPYKLARIDKRLSAYVRDVAHNPTMHNVYEQLAVRRFLLMMEKYGIEVRIVKSKYFLYEHLYFPGKCGMTNFKLTPVQCFELANIFGFWQNGKRIVHVAVIFIPRKFGKTQLAAFFETDDLLFGDANAEAYVGANSQDQARKCFDVIRGCMQRLDPDQSFYTINKEDIRSRRKDRSAFAQCLTSNARTKDGLNASLVVMDEFSQAVDSDLLYVLTTSMGVRDNPLTLIITTASNVFDGPFYEMLRGYKEVLLGEYEDDSLFAHIFEPDVDDPEDSEATWLKVHPHIGVTVSMDFYREQYKQACINGAEAMLAFRTKLLNVYAENETRSWISSTLAKHISMPIVIDDIKGRPDAMVAIDLSESGDFSAVTMGMYRKDKHNFYFHTAYFFPEGALKGHPNEKLYRVWAKKKYLHLTPGDVIDYRTIVDYVLYLNQHVQVLGVGYDPWKSQEMINMLAAAGGRNVLKGVKQTYGNFTAPVESFEHGAKTGHVFINDNPINFYCFGNAVLDSDKLENCKPVKRSDNQKIDGVITMLMCMRQFIDYIR